jgi:HAE1 family hydrophobic/amphiphilic exporter-1
MSQENTEHNAADAADAAKGAGGFSGVFVRRPVMTIVLNLLIVIAGIAALSGAEVRELPNIDRPVVTVRTDYVGASPETIDKEITAVIEGAVARTPGIESISSQSSAGQSRVTIEFNPSTDINVAANDLRDAIGNLRTLPDAAEAPTIVKADADSEPIIRLAATAPGQSIEDLTRIANDRIVDRLAAVEGVADIQMFGDRDPQIRIFIDPTALAARNLSIADVNGALATVGLDVPAGSVSDSNRTLLVRADASAKSADEIGAIRINALTRVSDIADVILGPADKSTSLRIDGQNGVGLGILRQANSNTLDISRGVEAAVEELNATLPDGITLRVTSDEARFIRASIEEVLITLLIATAIVIGVIFLFLRSIRLTFIPAVTVPIALIGTIAAIWLVGFSVNLLTLLALVLATGLVVDDAIVVIENINRRRRLGLGPRAAAVLGTRQVFFAVISTTLTLAAVFIPISFFPGTAGRLFSEFGFVLAFAVVLSSFVALTLCPMLASRLASAREETRKESALGQAITRLGQAATRTYARALDACLAAPIPVVIASLLFAGAAVIAYQLLPQELTPPEDRGLVIVAVNSPQGATVTYTEDQMRRVADEAAPLIESGEATAVFSITRAGGSGGFMVVTLADWHDRHRTQMEITAELNRKLQGIPGVQVSTRTSNSLGIRGGGQGAQFAITGTDYDSLAVNADKLLTAMHGDPAFGGVRLNYDTTQPQLSIHLDRERAASLGISVESIASVLQTLLSGRELGRFYQGDEEIKIFTEAPTGMIQDASGLDSIQLRSASGRMIPLSSLVTFTESAVAPNLSRVDQRRAVPMTAELGYGVDLASAMERVSEIAAAELPAGAGLVFTGEAKELQTASSGVLITFAFAVLVVLLVLAAQFESFNSAFILLATVPFGVAAAIFAILLTGGSLNIYSQVGLVMIVGLMAKNGILIVEFANQLRDAGQPVNQAIRNASLIRLRPVVMTMVATVLGGLPLIMRGGAGSEMRLALGWIIVGGLGFATIFTLFLTPVAFSLLARYAKPRAHHEQILHEEMAEAREQHGKVRDIDEPDIPMAAE